MHDAHILTPTRTPTRTHTPLPSTREECDMTNVSKACRCEYVLNPESGCRFESRLRYLSWMLCNGAPDSQAWEYAIGTYVQADVMQTSYHHHARAPVPYHNISLSPGHRCSVVNGN